MFDNTVFLVAGIMELRGIGGAIVQINYTHSGFFVTRVSIKRMYLTLTLLLHLQLLSLKFLHSQVIISAHSLLMKEKLALNSLNNLEVSQ